jgi:hypothetical protein
MVWQQALVNNNFQTEIRATIFCEIFLSRRSTASRGCGKCATVESSKSDGCSPCHSKPHYPEGQQI